MRNPIVVIIASILVALVAVGECYLARAFGLRELAKVSTANRPTVTFTRPADHETNVLPNIYISCDVNLPNVGAGVSQGSLFNGALKLYRTRDKQPVPFKSNTSGGGDSIVVTPDDLLEPNTHYAFEVTDVVKDTSNARFVPYTL